MKLLWSPRSPFARKVTVVAEELGISDRIELENVFVADNVISSAVLRVNPLNQIPTLICSPELILFDSSLIVSFLNSEFKGSLMSEGDRAWGTRRLEVVGDGLSQLNRRRRAEMLRTAGPDRTLLAAVATKTRATLDWLGDQINLDEEPSLGSIAVAAALGHLDFRFPEDTWRDGRASLARWFDKFNLRPSMQTTMHTDD